MNIINRNVHEKFVDIGKASEKLGFEMFTRPYKVNIGSNSYFLTKICVNISILQASRAKILFTSLLNYHELMS